MKRRIGLWAIVGFLVAGGWALYALAAEPPALTSGDPILYLVRLTCPIAIFSSYPIKLYWVLLANAATYALVALLFETLRQKLRPAR
jgi:hypothetical protein